MNRPLRWIGILFLIFISCTSRQPENSPGEAGENGARFGGTLVIGISSDIDTFNPLFGRSALGQEMTHLVLLGLADLDDRGEFCPELAESWERSADYMEITFHMRHGARWSDGFPVTAYDVEFTFDLLMDDEVASPRQGFTEFIRSVTAIDSYTVVFKFKEAYPDQMFDTGGEILPRHLLENADRHSLGTHSFGRQPVSSGPFLLGRWESKQYIELLPNPDYFGGRPYLDKVIFKIVPNSTSLYTQLKTGEVDMLLDVAPEQAEQLKADPSVVLHNVPGRVYNFVAYNQSNPLFTDAVVRRALTMAIDRRKIIDALLHGFGRLCVSSFPPMLSWAYNQTIQPLPYDPQKSRELLRSAGWRDNNGDTWLDRDGKTFEFKLITNADNSTRADVAVIVQDQLKSIGIKADIQLLEWTTMLEDMKNRNFEAYIGGLSTSLYVDPTPIFHSTATNLFNYVGYSNPEADRLIEAGRVEMDREKAAGIWQEFQELIHRDQPYTYLFWINKIVAVRKNYSNVSPITLSSLYNLEKWYLKD